MSWTRERAKVAALKRHRHDPNDPDVTDAVRDLAAARLEDYVRGVVDTFPPLTDDQRNRIAALLRPVESSGGRVA